MTATDGPRAPLPQRVFLLGHTKILQIVVFGGEDEGE